MSAERMPSGQASRRGVTEQRWLRPVATGRQPAPVGADASVLLTIDVEDYYQVAAFRRVVRQRDWSWYPSRVEANVDRLLDLLDQHGAARAVWFVLGWEAARRPAMVRRIAERGHELGCHSHLHRAVFRLTPREFRNDTIDAKRAIEDATGRPVHGYRAPSFSITRQSLWALEILAELGFTYDSSIFPVTHPHYGIPDAPPWPHPIPCNAGLIWELPPATTALFGRRWAVAGGAYLRHLPLAVVEAGLTRLVRRERQPAVLYLHPWEIDPDQPRLASSWLTRVRHRRNLHKTEQRLVRLLKRFTFTTAAQLIARLEARADGAGAVARIALDAPSTAAVGPIVAPD